MALILLKNLFFPTDRTATASYHQLESGSYASSTSSARMSTSTSDDGGLDDKFPCPAVPDAVHDRASRARINPRIISDATIGLSDGLTVPFALTAGLSALGDSRVVVFGGFAELIAGGISMGLGGYLGAQSEREACAATRAATRALVAHDPAAAVRRVHETFAAFELAPATREALAADLRAGSAQGMVDFLVTFHHQLGDTDGAHARPYVSGLTIAGGYFFGGLLPLLPYVWFEHIQQAFMASVCVMALALFAFGWTKTALVGETNRWLCCRNAVQMMVLGGVAAGAAMGCVKIIGG